LVTEATSSVMAGAGWDVSTGTAGGGLLGASSATPFSVGTMISFLAAMLFSTTGTGSGSSALCKFPRPRGQRLVAFARRLPISRLRGLSIRPLGEGRAEPERVSWASSFAPTPRPSRPRTPLPGLPRRAFFLPVSDASRSHS
jgi:hypothetical protein